MNKMIASKESVIYQRDKLDEHSIKALTKGITSCILLVISFIIGTQLIILYGTSLSEYTSRTYTSFGFEVLIRLIILININIFGMIIGISGIGHSNQVKQPKAVKITSTITSYVGGVLNSLGLNITILIILAPIYLALTL